MSRKTAAIGLMSLMLATTAGAQPACPCGGGALVNNTSTLSTLLGEKTVCAVLGAERWQEWHSGSNIFELGNNFATPDLAGNWAVSGAGVNVIVTYNYAGGSSYRYSVCTEGSNVHFCGAAHGGRNITNATLLAGKSACAAPAAAALRPIVGNQPGQVVNTSR